MALVLLRQERRSPKERAAELINRFDYADNFRKQYERAPLKTTRFTSATGRLCQRKPRADQTFTFLSPTRW